MEEDGIVLDMIDNVNLVEDDARVQNIESRIIERTCEYDILEELEAVGMVDLLSDKVVSYRNRLVEVCIDVEEFTVVGLVCGKLWIIYVAKSKSYKARR